MSGVFHGLPEPIQGVAVSCLFFTLDQSAFGILITWLPCLHTKHLPTRFWYAMKNRPIASALLASTQAVARIPQARILPFVYLTIGRVSYIRIYLCYFCFRWKTVSLVQASMQHLMHHVTVSLQQSKITLQNNCINNTSITQPILSFYLWLNI